VYEALNVSLHGKKLVAHNAKFDVGWLRAKGVVVQAHFDTFLAAHLLDENRSNRLKALARSLLGADNYESGMRFSEEAQPLKELAIYNGKDTDYTLRLYHLFREELKAQPKLLRLFKLLVMPACNEFVDIETRGFPVDIPRLKERNSELIKRIEDTENELIDRWVPEDLKGTRPNFRSPLFLAAWLFGDKSLRLPIIEISPKSRRPSTRESVLLQLRTRHPAVDKLLELRVWYKYESTYTRNWIERVRLAGRARLYTSYNLGGTVTGRLSSNMQQVPRNLYIRSILGFSKPGWVLLEADFSQVELRIAAMLSGDPELIRAFNTGADPHRQTAAAVMGVPEDQVNAEQRKMAKAVNFGFLYGMGSRKFKVYAEEKYGVIVTEAEAKAYRDAFFDKYAGLPQWHARQRRLVQDRGYVSSPTGRVRHLPNIASADEGIAAESERQAINSPVQGLASDFTVLSMVLLNQKLDHRVARVLGNLHDAVILEVRQEAASEVAIIVKQTMENLPLGRLFGFHPRVPIEVDVKIGTHWGEK
jgi:DNA polymerase-1